MVIQVIEFSSGVYKIRKKVLNFENLSNGEVSKSAKIKLSKSIAYVKNHGNLSHLIFMEEYQFRSRYFGIDIF
jgi:hypothetical protein